MLGDVTFGQYYNANSFVHKTDPRIKILLLIAYIVAVFLAGNFLSLAAVLVFLIIAVMFSSVPIGSVLRSIKAIFFLILFTAVLNVLFHVRSETDTVYFWVITKEGLLSAAFLASRLILLVTGSSLLTLTTTPVSLTDGLESLLKPLALIKFPVHELALIMSIALRMIPTLANETDRIICAQKARGADFESGNIISRLKALVPVLIPLIISALRRADELGDAMDARCYWGSKDRTKYKKLKLSFRDPVAVIFVGGLITGVVFLNIYYAQIISFFAAL
ncbi:MAG: energy-coupling factor transporter transmembrane protein EcfT [Clostridia bacterium]|nr:energy-coupling factor transporter transmembrane protein EcfT [Clostridia bacterium]